MKVLLNLLKAFAIVIGLYLLSVTGMAAIYFVIGSYLNWRSNGREGISSLEGVNFDPGGFVALTAFFILLAFTTLYLPPIGRLFAAITVLSFIVALWIWFGIMLMSPFH